MVPITSQKVIPIIKLLSLKKSHFCLRTMYITQGEKSQWNLGKCHLNSRQIKKNHFYSRLIFADVVDWPATEKSINWFFHSRQPGLLLTEQIEVFFHTCLRTRTWTYSLRGDHTATKPHPTFLYSSHRINHLLLQPMPPSYCQACSETF